MQTITSAATSLHQIPALHKSKAVKEWIESLHPANRIAVDIGCGKWPQDISTFMRKTYDCAYFPFDPYNMPHDTNAMTKDFIFRSGFQIALCANVLNVIDDTDAMRETIELCAVATYQRNGKAFFSIYEGDGSGIGKITRAGYQRNMKTKEYIPILKDYFLNIEIRGKVISAWS